MLGFTRTLIRRSVIVNLHGGRAFQGILYAKRGPLLVLKNVTMFEPGAAPTTVDGGVVIERDQVEFIQVTG